MLKRFFSDIKYVVVTMWAKGEIGEDTGLTLIARGIVVLAFMGLPLAILVLLALIDWIIP